MPVAIACLVQLCDLVASNDARFAHVDRGAYDDNRYYRSANINYDFGHANDGDYVNLHYHHRGRRASDVSGAGRALPVDAENFVIELFKGINPDIVSTPLIGTL